jgi:uncharacterized protein (TIGR03083 family)
MRPNEHLDWLQESVDWFLALDPEVLARPIRRCPGWCVDTVYDHLGRGVGVGRVAALRAEPNADVYAIMGAALPPRTNGMAARVLFAEAMRAYIDVLGELDPMSPCATYSGPGVVGFWIRRDAIELALHAGDVADALGLEFDIAPARASDAIDETIEFALPMALHVLARTSPAPCLLRPTDAPDRVLGGEGEPVATMTGTAHALLLALWGRGTIRTGGRGDTAREWNGLIEEAFRGPAPQ